MVSIEPSSRIPRIPVIPALAIGVWVFVVFAAWLMAELGRGAATLCHVRATLDIACPTCGGTRATFSLLNGQVLDALRFNPLVTVILIIATVWFVFRLATGRRVLLRLSRRGWRIATIVLVMMVALNWFYVLAAYRT